MKKRIILLCLSVIGLISMFFVDTFKLQFFCGALFFSIFFAVLSSMVKQITIQYLCILLFSLGFTVSGFELYSSVSLYTHKAESWIQTTSFDVAKFYTYNDDLGYAHNPNVTVNEAKARHFADGREPELIFDVKYSTDELGHRKTPVNPDAKFAVVFLGCSFTFGVGLNDEETYAYKVAKQLGRDYQVYNLGVGGYGTHQILASLAKDMSYLEKYERLYFFYAAIEDHLPRIAGLKLWAGNVGPMYIIKDDKLVRDGSFSDYFPRNIQNTKLNSFLNSSNAYKENMHTLMNWSLPHGSYQDQVILLRAMVNEIEVMLHNRFPTSVFSVLSWDKELDPVLTGVNKNPNIEYFDVIDWLPACSNFGARYFFEDGHPNVLAARYMSNEITKIVQSYEKTP